MSQEDHHIISESESEVTPRGSEDEGRGSDAEFEPLRTDGDSSAHNQSHPSIQVQLLSQVMDGDGHGVPQARFDGALPSSIQDVDQGQERHRHVDEVVLIRQHTKTSPTTKTSWSEDSIYPQEAMIRFESAPSSLCPHSPS